MRSLKWLLKRLDAAAALIIAVVCSIAGAFGLVGDTVLPSVTLATLALLAFTVLRDRDERDVITHQLARLEEQAASLIPTERHPTADDFFTNETDERLVLAGASESIWLVQETGRDVVEDNRDHLVTLLRTGGDVRLVVTAPGLDTARMVALRNANLPVEGIGERFSVFMHEIRDICRSANSNRLELRFSPYPLGTTSVIVDPLHEIPSQRRAIVREAGFKTPLAEKLDFALSGDTSPRVFTHYCVEFNRIFSSASKVVLINGVRGCGKTTLLNSLVRDSDIQGNEHLFYAISHPVWRDGILQGYEIEISSPHQRYGFATRRLDGSMSVKSDMWRQVAVKIEEALSAGKVIVLDEIGPMQLAEAGFRELLERALENPFSVIFATICHEDQNNPKSEMIKRHYRSSIVNLYGQDNSAQVFRHLKEELQHSLHAAQVLSAGRDGELRR